MPSNNKNLFFVSKEVLSALNSILEANRLPKQKVVKKRKLNILFKIAILPLKIFNIRDIQNLYSV